LIKKEINGTEAAKQMNLSMRQLKRIKVRVIKEGENRLVREMRLEREIRSDLL
jgi:hypothetical protein